MNPHRHLLLIIFSLPIIISCEQESINTVQEKKYFEVKCEEPIVHFSLGYDAALSKAEVEKLCNCIWQYFGDREKETSKALREGKEASVATTSISAFRPVFGRAIKECVDKSTK